MALAQHWARDWRALAPKQVKKETRRTRARAPKTTRHGEFFNASPRVRRALVVSFVKDVALPKKIAAAARQLRRMARSTWWFRLWFRLVLVWTERSFPPRSLLKHT